MKKLLSGLVKPATKMVPECLRTTKVVVLVKYEKYGTLSTYANAFVETSNVKNNSSIIT